MASLEQRYNDLTEAIAGLDPAADPQRLAELREQHAALDAECRRTTLNAPERHRLRRISLEADRLLTAAETSAQPSSDPGYHTAPGGLSADTITRMRAALDRYHGRSRFP